MNTEFNILWFEDNDEWYEIVSNEIEEYIKELCFHPNFIRFKNILTEDLNDVMSTYSFDLIFADLNLDQSDKGNDAIQLIRSNNILADALFYSTDGIDKIQSVMKTDVLEGVYLSIRNEYLFPDKAKKLINKAVKRSEDILNVRGMLMDNVSEFDEKLKESIRKYMSISSQKDMEELNEYAFDKVKEQFKDNGNKADELQENFILNALGNSFLIDSYKLSMIVNKIFKDKYPSYAKMKSFHSNYSKFILNERNQLAHAKKEPEPKGVFYFQDKKGNKIEYTPDKCKEIRQYINTYNDLLNEIIDIIK
jgi:hypothetical protein